MNSNRSDAVRHVAAMLVELRQIAERAGLNQLVTALDAACYEANVALDKSEKPTADTGKGDKPR